MSESTLEAPAAPANKGEVQTEITKILEGVPELGGESQPKPDKPDDSSNTPEPKTPSMDELLADPGENQDKKDAGGDTKKAPKTLAELAEIAGVELEDLYKLQVPQPDGRDPVTLGGLKDQHAESQRVADDSDLLETRTTEFENNMLRAKAELAEVIGLLGEVPPELIIKAKAQHQHTVDTERQALAGLMPSWSDPVVYGKAQDDMVEFVAAYGFTRNDVDSVNDHRFTKLIFDASQMSKRINRANASMKQVRQDGVKKRGTGTTKKQADTKVDIKPGDKRGQVAAVTSILTDG